MKIFFDCEMTGLHQLTTLISIGLVTETGQAFYAENMGYSKEQVTPWIQENVIKNLVLETSPSTIGHLIGESSKFTLAAYHDGISSMLQEWLKQFEHVEMWGDVLIYDWMLFCELFPVPNNDSAERLPRNIYYIPFDIATLAKVKGIDPDFSREEFSGISGKHNALRDAFMIMACYDKLVNL